MQGGEKRLLHYHKISTNESTVTALSYGLNNIEGLIVVFYLRGERHDLLKVAVEMASDKQMPLDACITRLGEQIDAKRHNLAKIESKWKATIRPLEEKKHNLEEAICAKQLDSQHKHQNWKKLKKDLIGSLAEFYKDTGHLTGNNMFHALMLARFFDACFWQAKLVASSRKRHVDKRGSRAVQVGSRAVHNESMGGSKRYKSSGSSSFNTESGKASINLNTNVGDNDEDEVQEIRRPMGRHKARYATKKKGSRASGSSSMNDEALARLMVTEMTAQEKEQRDSFVKIKRREVEWRERELAAQEYRQRQEDVRFYLQPYDHLTGEQRMAMKEARAEIKAKYNLPY
uniref:No apical meristem-associated C-terminal domain-containing protein n=1 Tax=Tanacetum cinerariifolium TaxID=118510 RepID=A0A6L2PAD0_TANCI|nr:hypothetical protein [Tanacetum cinerariifolium]